MSQQTAEQTAMIQNPEEATRTPETPEPEEWSVEYEGEVEADELYDAEPSIDSAFDGILQDTDTKNLSAKFTIVTRQKTANRHGNMVRIVKSEHGDGMIDDVYQRAPVVMLEHGFDTSFPVALSSSPDGTYSLKATANRLSATAYFNERLPESMAVFEAVDAGFLRMASIGFMPLKAMLLKRKAQKELAEGVEDVSPERWRGWDYVEWELYEWSIVASGADRGSFRQCLERGKIREERLRGPLKRMFQRWAERPKALGIGRAPDQVIITEVVPQTETQPESPPATPTVESSAGVDAPHAESANYQPQQQALVTGEALLRAWDQRTGLETLDGRIAQMFDPARQAIQQADRRLTEATGTVL